jgi:DNA-binding protein YbaB
MGTDALAGPDARLDEYRALAAQLNRMSDDLIALRVTATSADGCVTATVGPTGELNDVRIDPHLAGGLEPAALARRVLEAATLAAGEARVRRMDAVSAILPEHLWRVMTAPGQGGR